MTVFFFFNVINFQCLFSSSADICFCTRVRSVQKKIMNLVWRLQKSVKCTFIFPRETVCCDEKRNINVNLFSYTETEGIKEEIPVDPTVPVDSSLPPMVKRVSPPGGATCSTTAQRDVQDHKQTEHKRYCKIKTKPL